MNFIEICKKPPNNETFTNNQDKKNKLCDACNAWRPPRAFHCVSCNACTLKYDHHCPWILNCVGARNHKAFYLFSVYLMVDILMKSSLIQKSIVGVFAVLLEDGTLHDLHQWPKQSQCRLCLFHDLLDFHFDCCFPDDLNVYGLIWGFYLIYFWL